MKQILLSTVSIFSVSLLFILSGCQASKSSEINQTLIKMESPAEDMLEEIEEKDMDEIKEYYQVLKKGMEKLNQIDQGKTSSSLDENQSKGLALQNSWFDLISLELEEADDLPALANVVNQFSGGLILLTKYQHLGEQDLAWLDYLGREIVLLNTNYPKESASLIKIRKASLNKTWSRVKKILDEDKKNSPLIAKTDQLISQIAKTSDAKKLIVLGNKELDIVDEIEKALSFDQLENEADNNDRKE